MLCGEPRPFVVRHLETKHQRAYIPLLDQPPEGWQIALLSIPRISNVVPINRVASVYRKRA